MAEAEEGAQMPKEAQVMAGILRDLGITQYDPGVLTQMLEFSYKYTSNILKDAKMYSNHARKRGIDCDDIKLAVQVNSEQTVTTPPPKELLIELSEAKNSVQLPLIKPGAGLRLPPDRHCLTSTNYRLKSAARGGGGSGHSAVSGGGGRKPNGLGSTPSFNIQVQGGGFNKRKWENGD